MIFSYDHVTEFLPKHGGRAYSMHPNVVISIGNSAHNEIV
jgi:hypothetical protein